MPPPLSYSDTPVALSETEKASLTGSKETAHRIPYWHISQPPWFEMHNCGQI